MIGIKGWSSASRGDGEQQEHGKWLAPLMICLINCVLEKRVWWGALGWFSR